eukprot:543127_1
MVDQSIETLLSRNKNKIKEYLIKLYCTQGKELGVAVCGIIFGAIYEAVSGAIYEVIFGKVYGKVYATVFGVVYNKNEKHWQIKNMKFIIREKRNMVMEEKNYNFQKRWSYKIFKLPVGTKII